jgi:hypothetical protein
MIRFVDPYQLALYASGLFVGALLVAGWFIAKLDKPTRTGVKKHGR